MLFLDEPLNLTPQLQYGGTYVPPSGTARLLPAVLSLQTVGCCLSVPHGGWSQLCLIEFWAVGLSGRAITGYLIPLFHLITYPLCLLPTCVEPFIRRGSHRWPELSEGVI